MRTSSTSTGWYFALGGILLLVAAGSPASGSAALQAQAAEPTVAPPAAAAPVHEDRRLTELGPGDQVSVQVYGQPDMSTNLYVGDDGKISMPLVGPVMVSGLSPIQAAQRVEQALKDGQFLVDPHVSIAVVQNRSQRVSVLGAVGRPGRYAIEPNTSIFDLLAEAGGVGEASADVIYVQRSEPDGTVKRYPVDLRPSGDQGRSTFGTLQAGDQIYVPTADQFYIYGEVSSPNKYRIEPGMTVIQAIARAGGVTPRGSSRRIDLKRLDANHQYVTRHAKPDEPVEPGDVLHVKESIF